MKGAPTGYTKRLRLQGIISPTHHIKVHNHYQHYNKHTPICHGDTPSIKQVSKALWPNCPPCGVSGFDSLRGLFRHFDYVIIQHNRCQDRFKTDSGVFVGMTGQYELTEMPFDTGCFGLFRGKALPHRHTIMVSAGERESDEKKRDDSFNPLLTLCFDGKSPFFSFLISETKLHSILRKMKRERHFLKIGRSKRNKASMTIRRPVNRPISKKITRTARRIKNERITKKGPKTKIWQVLGKSRISLLNKAR